MQMPRHAPVWVSSRLLNHREINMCSCRWEERTRKFAPNNTLERFSKSTVWYLMVCCYYFSGVWFMIRRSLGQPWGGPCLASVCD